MLGLLVSSPFFFVWDFFPDDERGLRLEWVSVFEAVFFFAAKLQGSILVYFISTVFLIQISYFQNRMCIVN